MKKKTLFTLSASLFIVFILFTLIVKFIDVGTNNVGSSVGLSALNIPFSNLVGVHFTLYTITDWAEILAILIGISYAIMGLIQWIKRKNINKVDLDIRLLGIFYVIVFAVYVVFIFLVINCRPVLINGILESSYPSSTTILAITFLTTSLHFTSRLLKGTLKDVAKYGTIIYMLFLIIVRIISGVHWFTDILGSLIISASLVCLYYGMIKEKE